jgi:hypothetical protein
VATAGARPSLELEACEAAEEASSAGMAIAIAIASARGAIVRLLIKLPISEFLRCLPLFALLIGHATAPREPGTYTH